MTAIDVRLRGRDATQGAFASVTNRVRRLDARLGKLGLSVRGIAGGLGVASIGTAVVTLARHVTRTIDQLDELHKAAANADVPPSVLQSWRLFGELGGASAQQVDTSLRRIRRRLGEALQGQEVANSFAALDVEVRNADGSARSLDDVTKDLVRNLGSAENKTVAFAAAVRIGDLEFARLAQQLIANGYALDGMIESAEQFGLVVHNDIVERAAEVNDSLTVMGQRMSVTSQTAFAPLIDKIGELTDAWLVWVGAADDSTYLRDSINELESFATRLERVGGLSLLVSANFNAGFDEIEDHIQNASSVINELALDGLSPDKVAKAYSDLEDEIARVYAAAGKGGDTENYRLLGALLADITEKRKAADEVARETVETDEFNIDNAETIDKLARNKLQLEAKNKAIAERILEIKRETLAADLQAGKITEQEYAAAVKALEPKKAKTAATVTEAEKRRQAIDDEIAAMRVATERLGLTENQIALDEVDRRIAASKDETERARLGVLREAIVANQERAAVLTDEQRRLEAIAELEAQRLDATGTLRDQLLENLGITEQDLEANEELRTLFADILKIKQEQAAGDQVTLEGTLEQLRIENQRRDALAEELALMVRLGELSAQEASQLAATLGIRDLENEKLLEQQHLMEGVVGIARGYDDSLEGILGTLGRVLDLWRQFDIGRGGTGGGQAGSFFSQLLGSFGGARATGGSVQPGKFYVTGERGVELFAPDQAGRIIPNDQLGGSLSITNHLSIPGPISVRDENDMRRIEAMFHKAIALGNAKTLQDIRNGRIPATVGVQA